MTLEQKAGMLMIDTLNARCAGTLDGTPALKFVRAEKMTRFILRNVASAKADAATAPQARAVADSR
jgi:beta-glucosidase